MHINTENRVHNHFDHLIKREKKIETKKQAILALKTLSRNLCFYALVYSYNNMQI